MEKYILALDQGTSSSRAVIFNALGLPVASAQKELPSFYPHPGWVEQDPAEILKSQLLVLNEVITKSKISKSQIVSIGITNQRETTIIWDKKSGKPVSNAIVWQDRRTLEFCARLGLEGHANLFAKKTGLIIDPYFSASKIRWILDNISDGQKRAEAGELAFGTVDSWLLWNLTGGKNHGTDITNASRTMIYNIETLDWDAELLKILNIPKVLLPKVQASASYYGEAIGDFAGLPINGIAGDQQAALFGQVCFNKGMVKNTYGTGCFLLMNVGESKVQSKNKLITTLTSDSNTKASYALEGSVFVAGATMKWLRDSLGLINSTSEIEEIATSVSDNGNVFLVPAFSGLGAPHWDPDAKGIISGLNAASSKAHIVRAAVEAMAFQTADVLNAMEADSKTKVSELRVDGGASVNNFLLQFQADISNVPVLRSSVSESTALGAAYLAGLNFGFWKSKAELEVLWQRERVFLPQMRESKRLELIQGWNQAVSRTKTK